MARYDALSSNDEIGASQPLEKESRGDQARWTRMLPWVLTGFFALTSLFLGVVVDSQCPSLSSGGSFSAGFATDFGMSTHRMVGVWPFIVLT